MEEDTENRFLQVVFAILVFGPTMANVLMADWLQRMLPGLPTLLEYALLSLPALLVVAILFAYKPRVVAWLRKIDERRRNRDGDGIAS
jgi:cation transporter-like permease